MIDVNQIKPHMSVVGANDKPFATVDHVQGKSLKLTKDTKGEHHFIPLDWIDRVDDKVHVNKNGDEVMKQWTTSPGGDAE